MTRLTRSMLLALMAGIGFEFQSRVVDYFLDQWLAAVPSLAWLVQ